MKLVDLIMQRGVSLEWIEVDLCTAYCSPTAVIQHFKSHAGGYAKEFDCNTLFDFLRRDWLKNNI